MDQRPRIPITLFYSYAREDEALRNRLEKHLSLLQRRGFISAWHDRQIVAGTNWSHAIDHHLNESSIILLLISPDFLASDYCYNTEMQLALERHRRGDAHVIPVLLRPVDWQGAPFAHLQCLPRDAKPVTEWANQDAAFRDITEGLRHTIEQRLYSQQAGKTERSEETVSRTRYLKYLINRYSSVTLPLGPVEGFSLQAIFQPLTLRRDPLAAEDLQPEKRRVSLGESASRDDQPPTTLKDDQPPIVAKTSEEALEKSPQKRLVILGGPGTGKTTMLQVLIYEQALKALNDPAVPLPLMVSLPELARSGRILEEYIFRLIREARVQDQFVTTLRKVIEDGQTFICLDSLDEVSPNQRPDMIRTINELAASAGNTWVIGSRFTDYKGGQFKRGGFAEWELQPMTSSLRRELATRLLPELYRLLQPERDQVGDEALTFTNLLETHAQAAAWGENPLLFSLAAVIFVRLGRLPLSRAALYGQVIGAVLETREKDPARRKVLRRALADLALALYTAKRRTFSLDDLLALLPVIRQRQHENWATEEIAQRIITSGMLDVLAHETYGFRHQTFREYLAAVELAQRLVSRDQGLHDETWEFVWSKRTYSRWIDVLSLMVGVLGQDYRLRGVQQAIGWLQALGNQRHMPEADPGDLGLALAIKSVSEIAEDESPQSWNSEGGLALECNLASDWVDSFLDTVRHDSWPRKWRLRQLAADVGRMNTLAVRVVVQPLITALSDANDRMRREAVDALGKLGRKIPIEDLLAAAASPDRNQSYAALTVLEDIMKLAPVATWVAAVNDEHPSVRRAALRALGNLGSWASLEPLMAALNDKETSVRAAAVAALGNLGERAPIEALVVALHEDDYQIHGSAILALVTLSEYTSEEVLLEVLLTALRRTEGWGVPDILTALGKRGINIPVEPLVEALQKPRKMFDSTQIKVAKALGKLRAQAPIPPLVAALRHEDYDIREAAAEALGDLGVCAPIEPLVNALLKRKRRSSDPSRSPRQNVPAELDTRHIRYSFDGTRATAAWALGEMGSRTPAEPLLAVLGDPDERVRTAAAQALSKQVGVTSLLDQLNKYNISARLAALQVLGALKDQVPVKPLQVALQDSDSKVRLTVIQVLEYLEPQISINLLLTALHDDVQEVRWAAAKVVDKFGEKVPVEPMIAALQDANPEVRAVAARALGKLGEHTPVQALLAALHDSRKDEYGERRSG